jgi:hypothetical protein
MPTSFLDLPAELRNEIYKHLFLFREPIIPWKRYNDKKIATNLLLTNKTILHEASSILYSSNCFNLIRWDPRAITKLLDDIGVFNASRLRCIRVTVPGFCRLDDDSRACLGEYCLRASETVRSYHTDLKSLAITPE